MSRDALVVGINKYNFSGLSALRSPANDAEAIAKRLSEAGNFHVQRLPQFLDPFENDAPRISANQEIKLADLEKALEKLFYPEGRSIPDTSLFYFSGHGLRKDGRIKEGFLATSDTDPELGNWGLRLKWLRELLEESPVRQQIIWLDCCYSGELLNFTEADPGDRGNTRDRCFIAASREFELAHENVSGASSVLTSAILRGFDLADLSNQWVTNETLVTFLRQELETAPQKFISNNLGCINLFFRKETTNKQPVQSTVQTSSQPNQTDKLAEQLRAWFTALRYGFEKGEISNEHYFEWIINVNNPIEKKGYNRMARLKSSKLYRISATDFKTIKQCGDEAGDCS
ncbi:caspase family protein [Nostoc sp. 'Peltigera membranacea cyanobiont' N6]|uniref:caspase family protein n=1 Tax=Nostoc sp. 'Peltigera membranacea cyanobiont' N6 TaxID=1261031 RepID=UPI000D0C213F|nr:caspase family protein [Nostoc sp. 'Peltigera membranacea cyanobiont' N6]AVH65238.1 peptidase C14/caspase domain protein [Nostoc sp. 'Peltigera membranacea cyanobiont' N6]